MSDTNKSWFARHKILTAILALIVITIVVNAAGGGSDTGNNNSGTSNQQSSAEDETENQPTEAKIGEAVRDGKFEFIVRSVECGATEVVHPDTDALRKDAQGQFCKMTVNVKNIGNEQQYFSESDQKLLNAQGQEFKPDTMATSYNGGNNDTLFAQINPGNSVEGVLVFDVPKDVTPTHAQLHDSAFSNGVKVTL